MRRLLLSGLIAVVALFGLQCGSTGYECLDIYFPGAGCVWITSVDSMKLSKDQENNGLTNAQIDAAVTQMAAMNSRYITVVTHYDLPDVMYQWVTAIRAHNRHVWFRAGIRGWGNGTITPDDWLARYRTFLETYTNNPSYPNFFQRGDIFDGNAESENGYTAWCHCSLYGGTSWTDSFNQFLMDQTTIADEVFGANGFTQGSNNIYRDILTTIHSVDPGSSTGVLSQQEVSMMGIVTVDAYPDQDDTDPTTAANHWISQLQAIHNRWPDAKIVIGEMGYSNHINVADTPQRDVIAAELRSLLTASSPNQQALAGMNYWVGPGSSTAGGYTYVLRGSVSTGWAFRPAASCLAAFFAHMANGNTALC